MPNRDISTLDLDPKYLNILRALLKEHTPNAEVWIYGSRVTGTAHSGSDLDLVLRNPQDLAQDISGWHPLKEAITDSIIPIIIDLHQWAYLPPSFHGNIEKDHIILQIGKANTYVPQNV